MNGRLIDGLALREWGDPADPGILLWPGLGSTSTYFSGLAGALPGRALAVDPPGFGQSPAWDPCTYERLVEAAQDIVDTCDCRAIVGHSLGADVALGVAAEPPERLRAAVLIDGGYLDAQTRAQFGLPTAGDRAEVVAWARANSPRFPDWDTAIRELASMIGVEPTPAIEAFVRSELTEVDGEICDNASPESVADLLLAVVREDFAARARTIAVPTLLIACGQPPEHRAARQNAWEEFARASPLIELHVAEQWSHNPLLQDPQGSASLIADWLSAHL